MTTYTSRYSKKRMILLKTVSLCIRQTSAAQTRCSLQVCRRSMHCISFISGRICAAGAIRRLSHSFAGHVPSQNVVLAEIRIIQGSNRQPSQPRQFSPCLIRGLRRDHRLLGFEHLILGTGPIEPRQRGKRISENPILLYTKPYLFATIFLLFTAMPDLYNPPRIMKEDEAHGFAPP